MKSKLNKMLAMTLASMLSGGMVLTGNMVTAIAEEEKDDSKIIIVSTNDAHCNIDTKENEDPNKAYLGYACVAGIYKEKQKIYSNVALVDSGDHIQGAPIGLLSKGQDIINIMNRVGYTVSTIGNHEFDYGVDRLLELTHPSSTNENKANYSYVSCNFLYNDTSETVYKPYTMESYTCAGETIDVAFVGITTPETVTLTAADVFNDESGNLKYNFCQDNTGEKLYAQIQNSIDTARADGAEYVILLGHVGQDGRPDKWRSDTIVNNISGADAFIDGHSHEKYIKKVADKTGKEIYVTQTGTMLNAVGVMTIDVTNNEIMAEIVQAPVDSDSETAEYIAEINSQFNKMLDEKISETSVLLNVFEEDDYSWLVRESETNMGDLITDAFRAELGTDIAMIGGGSIRDKIEKGDITYRNALSVQPFGNDTAVIKASGRVIKDALELGAMKYPEASGAFMQVSGLTYEIATDIESSVKLDDNGAFVSVEGEYRVRNIKVGDEPLDLDRIYTVGGITYTLVNGGDGLSMFKNCEVVIPAGAKDFDVFANYLKKIGTIGEEYANITGQGRIKMVEAGNVDTGDNSNYYAAIMLVFAVGAAIVTVTCRKKQQIS